MIFQKKSDSIRELIVKNLLLIASAEMQLQQWLMEGTLDLVWL